MVKKLPSMNGRLKDFMSVVAQQDGQLSRIRRGDPTRSTFPRDGGMDTYRLAQQ